MKTSTSLLILNIGCFIDYLISPSEIQKIIIVISVIGYCIVKELEKITKL